jgi:uncharacterized membrane protein YvbJ
MQLLGGPPDEEQQRWYCYRDDQVWLEKEQKWKGQIMLPTEQHAVKYCKKCGNKLELEDAFCDRCGAKQKMVVTLDQQETIAKPGDAKSGFTQTKPTSLWYLLPVCFSVLGGIIGYVAVKDENKKMADDLLIIGIVICIICVVCVLLFLL